MVLEDLRRQLVRLLDGVDAHMPFEEAVRDFPDEAMNERPPNVGYTPWHLVEHLRLTQWDILDYVTNPTYVEREWPREYWPDPSANWTAGPSARCSRPCCNQVALPFAAVYAGPSVRCSRSPSR